ncbi:hypothetical protein [Pseudosulfitobacter sp. SM2401]|uniref:hypothetical protein n=1 Tax=Pseudosulfitobacter sp. SM2401 TaxID=3350098 RepID=UPI0036F303D9
MALNKLHHAKLKSLPIGKHSDGGNLVFWKRSATSGSFIFVYSTQNKRKTTTLDSVSRLPFGDARAGRKPAQPFRGGQRSISFSGRRENVQS